MQLHRRAKLGPAGRLALCQAIESGMTFRQAAACLNVSRATAHRWWHRYAVASAQKRPALILRRRRHHGADCAWHRSPD
jgi:transposase-like protein